MRRQCGSTPTSPRPPPDAHAVHQGTTPSRAPTLGDLGLCTVQPHQHTLAVKHIAPSYSRVQGCFECAAIPHHNRSSAHGESDGDLSVRSPG